jgi:copper chaperone CopZ
MKSIKNTFMLTILLVSFTSSIAQIKNQETVSEKILGNCGMCEKNIEKAGNLKNVASVDWDKETKMATISYDTKKTNKDEILKRIALAGYDSDSFLAPDDVYSNLHGCCQYDRVNKTASLEKPNMKMEMKEKMDNKMKSNEKQNQLELVYASYFGLKDALVASDSKLTSKKATELVTSIEKVDMSALKMDVHMVWMKVLKSLKVEAKAIATSKDIEAQRKQFITISNDMVQLMKVKKMESPVYYQFCPMANNGKGANWLSQESAIKNPYYGSQMLTCGKTVEKIK